MSKTWDEYIEWQKQKQGRRCIVCGQDLPTSARLDRKFCSANCRKRYSRRKEPIQKAYTHAMGNLGVLRRNMKQWPDLQDDIHDRLKGLRQEIDFLLRLYDPDTQQEQSDRAELITGLQNKRYLSPSEAREISRKNGL